eukprot:Gb_17583 [translate_table: standard]
MAHVSDICDDYCLKITATEVVAPALPMQEHWLPQSNLDLLLPPVNVGVFFCYKKPSSKQSFASVVASLKNSLSEVLVSYYAFAGRLVTNSNGEPELLCNNEGVEFSEAYADIRLAQVDFHNPDATVEGKIVPPRSPFPDKNNDRVAVFCVQVTKFKCGAVVVGCTFDHRVADAHSANMFMVSWAEVCRNQSISSIPTFRRSLLNPRRPPRYTSAIDDMYVTLSSLVAESNNIDPSPPLASRIYYLHAKDIDNLQSLATQNCTKKYSKLEAFCAYLWRLINISGNNDEDQEESGNKLCRMGVVVDGRSRFAKLQVPATYFGNVLSIPYAEASVGEVTKKSLSWRADLIHRAIADAANEEHFRSLVDWVEKQRPDGALAKIYCKADSPSVVVSSGLRFPISKMDFGWGKSAFASYHFPWGGEAGYVMPMPSPLGDGDWVVYMHLSLRQLNAIESHPDFLLHPIIPQFLGLRH